MVVYYEDESVRITSHHIEVAGRSYPLAELSRVWHRRGTRSWRALAGRGALAAALLVPLAAVVIGLAVAVTLDTTTARRAIIVGASVVLGLMAAPLLDPLLDRLDLSYARGTREHQIWARRRGTDVLLVHTGDALRFGRIYRAVQRAMERADAGAR